MKIKAIILAVIAVAILLNSLVIVLYTAGEVGKIGETTSTASTDVLLASAGDNLEDISIGIRDSLDDQMAGQYSMIKTWATAPVLLDVAELAQTKTKEELYEMWSAAATREWEFDADSGIYEAMGDGLSTNDLSSDASDYLTRLNLKTDQHPEIFITDNRGYAIAANVATGDFDQGPDDWRIFKDSENGTPYFLNNTNEYGEGWYKMCNPDYADSVGFYVTDVDYDDSSGFWGIDMVCQMKHATTDAYLGQIKVLFDYGTFVKNFVNLEGIDVYRVLVLSSDGTIVATSETGDTGSAKVNTVSLSDKLFFAEIAGGTKNGYIADTDEDGNNVYYGYAVSQDAVSGNGHIIVVSKLESGTGGVMAPINTFVDGLKTDINDAGAALQTSILIIAIIVLIVLVGIAYAIINAKISTPLKKLTDASNKLAKGDLKGLSINVSGDDEIGQLGEGMKGVQAAFETIMSDK